MSEIFGIPSQALFGQLMLGLINGAFYAMMSLGLALIFGVLNIINFTHGAQYMMGAFIAWLLLQYFGISYWVSLAAVPVIVGITGAVFERLLLRHLYHLDHLYGFLLTFGMSLLVEGFFRHYYGVSGQPYQIPEALTGSYNLGFMFLPKYRIWVVAASLAICLGTWWVVERTQLGAYLRAGTENPTLVRAFGVNVPRMITLTYVFGASLAAFAGVLAAPIYQVSSIMGSNIIPIIFAVVVIGGLGSIMG
ncbi:MAG: branched-chain amino acid ABC transporter permease, partial [Terriglobales bacterium]